MRACPTIPKWYGSMLNIQMHLGHVVRKRTYHLQIKGGLYLRNTHVRFTQQITFCTLLNLPFQAVFCSQDPNLMVLLGTLIYLYLLGSFVSAARERFRCRVPGRPPTTLGFAARSRQGGQKDAIPQSQQVANIRKRCLRASGRQLDPPFACIWALHEAIERPPLESVVLAAS